MPFSSFSQNEKQDEYIFILNLIMIREFYGMKQREMVARLGNNLNIKRYQSWEERRAFPSIFFIRIVSESFSIPIARLLTERLTEEKLRNLVLSAAD